MRAAPLGAYFSEDIDKLIEQAMLSAQVTHLHSEAQAGAVAVALAAARAWTRERTPGTTDEASLLEFVEERTPHGEVRLGIRQAMALADATTVARAASVLGSGYRSSAQDTVPFCLWCASKFSASFETALWNTVSAMGDRDTTCAIVGGVVVMSAGLASIPERWMSSREGIPMEFRPTEV
jgi:ADP-ribosylglycohydrolase